MFDTAKVFDGLQLSWKYPTTVGNVAVNVGVWVGVGVIEVQVLLTQSWFTWIFTPTSAEGNLPQ